MRWIGGAHPIAVGFLTFIVSRIGLSPFVGVPVCNDGWHSMSIGGRGACSWHGGVGGLDHGNWVMPVTVVLAVAAGFVWNALQSKRVEFTDDPAEQRRRVCRPLLAEPSRIEPQASSRILNDPSQSCKQSVSRESAWLQCPKCAAGMKLRTAQRGRFAGQQFWGCSRFPSCSEIVNIKRTAKTSEQVTATPAPSSSAPLPQPALPPEELERLREKTRSASEESAAYIAAELAKAKLRHERLGSSKPVGKYRSHRRRF
ncbi:MAG: hypothetical protein E5X37_27125 [Mesorhizobium sp.]|nr:MAG: hypothetical protein E5X37_27125 [Mesorhizobium sp.]